MKRFLFSFCLSIAIFASVQPSFAQVGRVSVTPDSVVHAFVPLFGYSSSTGLILGGLYNRFDYTENIRPFNSYLEVSALASFKGYVKVEGKYERTQTFGRKIRSAFNVFFRRYLTNNFFGIGNNTSFSKSRWKNEYYYFESVSLGFNYQSRKLIYSDAGSQLDLLFGAGIEYQIPYVRKRPSSFARLMPKGSKGGWVNYLKGGLIWENRDNEFDPRHGNYAEFEVRFAPEFISTYALTTLRLELRQYFYLFDWVTVANRFEARHAMGEVPYWEKPTLGDDLTLRGYPLNRFRGNSSIAYTLELRTWLIKFPDFYNLKFGGQLFTDVGRVFTDQSDFADLFEGYKQTFGFGGAMSVFSPDLILRGDVGFSEDMTQIYVGVGYLF
ncbi:MAG TPA: BamA/TamA family outer membrane protein [Balneolaceae bacterium]|nr:BamA/TamA family outer membrane protein [Balneolaceae bacterium]